MTREERIEAAARAIDPGAFDAEAWRRMRPDLVGFYLAQKHALETVERVLRAAIPELMSDPPTGWVAPWNATETIRDTIWGAVIPLPEDSQEAAEIDVWADVRDAHTKDQT